MPLEVAILASCSFVQCFPFPRQTLPRALNLILALTLTNVKREHVGRLTARDTLHSSQLASTYGSRLSKLASQRLDLVADSCSSQAPRDMTGFEMSSKVGRMRLEPGMSTGKLSSPHDHQTRIGPLRSPRC